MDLNKPPGAGFLPAFAMNDAPTDWRRCLRAWRPRGTGRRAGHFGEVSAVHGEDTHGTEYRHYVHDRNLPSGLRRASTAPTPPVLLGSVLPSSVKVPLWAME